MAENAGAIVETSGLIVNRIVWSDEVPTMDFGEGLTAVKEPDDAVYTIGGTLVDGVYTAPSQPEPPPPPEPVPTAEQAVLFNHENRIRGFEGREPISLANFVGEVANLK